MHPDRLTVQWTAFHSALCSVLFQPPFQPQCVDAVEIVPKQTLVTYKAELLVQMKCSTVGDLCLQNNLTQCTTLLIIPLHFNGHFPDEPGLASVY